MKPLEKKEKELLDNWQSREYKEFCRDGVVCHEKMENNQS